MMPDAQAHALPHDVHPDDESHLLYGNFIGVQFVFGAKLDEARLQHAIDILITRLPALAGRYDRKGGRVTAAPEPVALVVEQLYPGGAQDHAHIGSVQENRHDFVDEPSRRDVQAGLAPLSTFKLTTFQGRGCIFGLAVSHVLADAAGVHLIARTLAEIYTALADGKDPAPSPLVTKLPVFAFGTDRSKKEVRSALAAEGMHFPVKLTGVMGGLVRKMIIGALDKMAGNQRIIITLGAEQLSQLKRTVLAESGEQWISTNVALSAHFTKVMAQLMYGDSARHEVQLGQLIDLRGRYFEEEADEQVRFVGNAILIHTFTAGFPDGIQAASRGALARVFKKSLGGIDTDSVKQRMDLIADCLRLGYAYPGLELKNPMIALNNQSKMPVYDLAFAGQKPVRVIPQDVGDNIMFFPTPDGGIEIYIRDILNPARQNELQTPDWQARIYDF